MNMSRNQTVELGFTFSLLLVPSIITLPVASMCQGVYYCNTEAFIHLRQYNLET